MDIPYTFSNEIVPPTPKADYEETTLDMFISMLHKLDPHKHVWKYWIDSDRVIYRSRKSILRIDRVYARITRELLDKYHLSDVHVRIAYNISDVGFIALYWNATEAKRNIGIHRPTIVLNMYFIRYMPVEAIHDTILHEIAHVLLNGDAHSEKWRAIALALGSKATVESGFMNSRYIAENRYDANVVFRCKRRCFLWIGKFIHDESVIHKIVRDCLDSGEMDNENMRCDEHDAPVFLFPPKPLTISEYKQRLLTEHEEFTRNS